VATSTIIVVTFIDISTFLLVTAFEFKARKTSTVVPPRSINAVVVTTPVSVRTLVYVFTFDLVLSKEISFVTSTNATTGSIDAIVMAAAIIDLAFIDVCAVLPVCLKHIASITGADHILSFAHVELGALVIASSVVNRTVQRRWRRCGYTAVQLISAISAIITAITPPYLINAHTIVACQLIAAAGAVSFI